jgi:hypothetical protein
MPAPNYDNPTDPRALADSPWGKIERWRADAMALGGMSAYDEYMKTVRADSEATQSKHDAREKELDAREAALDAREAALRDGLTKLVAPSHSPHLPAPPSRTIHELLSNVGDGRDQAAAA